MLFLKKIRNSASVTYDIKGIQHALNRKDENSLENKTSPHL